MPSRSAKSSRRSAVRCAAVSRCDNSHAEASVKAAPKHHKVLFENERLRVLEVTLEPNEARNRMQEDLDVVVHKLSGLP